MPLESATIERVKQGWHALLFASAGGHKSVVDMLLINGGKFCLFNHMHFIVFVLITFILLFLSSSINTVVTDQKFDCTCLGLKYKPTLYQCFLCYFW